jgi:hypothetical protein
MHLLRRRTIGSGQSVAQPALDHRSEGDIGLDHLSNSHQTIARGNG